MYFILNLLTGWDRYQCNEKQIYRERAQVKEIENSIVLLQLYKDKL
jgi:hypothetical protein